MSLTIDKDQLKGLINFAKNEVLDQERSEAAMMENLGALYNNDMQLHRVAMMSLTHAGQANMAPPVGAFPVGQLPQDIALVFKAVDPYTNKILERLHRQATYFACFANAGAEYPNNVVEEARDILKVGIKEAMFNELDLRFANIAILMELLDRQSVNYGEGYFTFVAEKAMNGGQPYSKATLKFFHPRYTGNVYQIEKTVYQYGFQYTHLDKTYNNSISFSNGDGTQIIQLPDGLLVFLNALIAELYKEYNGNFQSLKQLIVIKVEFITRHMGTIYDNCMSKFKEEDNLTHEEKMSAIRSFVRGKLQYARTLTMHGHRVADISQFDVDVSDDNELLVFGTQVHTFGVTTEVNDQHINGRHTYEKKKVRFEFNHLGVSNVNEELENEDDNVLLFNLWVLNAFEKDFQSVVQSIDNINVLRKHGYTD